MFTPQLLLYGMAVLLLAFFLPAIANPKAFRKAMKSFASDKNLVRATSITLFIIAFIFLSVHWKFEGKWMMVISIFGWLTLLKGLVWLWHPEFVKKKYKKFFDSDSAVVIWSIMGIVLAAFLAYVAMELIEVGEVVAG